jgi:hypothetical protein
MPLFHTDPMNSHKLTSALLLGVFTLIVISVTAHAQRPTRGGGTITPPPAEEPVISPR